MEFPASAQGIPDIVRFHAGARGSALALEFEGRRTSYDQLLVHGTQIARRFCDMGLPPQARIAYLGKNSDRFFDVLLGAAMSAMVLVPINWRLALPEMVEVLEDSRAHVLFVGPGYADYARDLKPLLPGLQHLVFFDACGAPTDSRLDDWYRDEPAGASAWVPDEPGAVVMQMYTSGTTGRAKGVELTNANFLALCRSRVDSGDIGPWGPGDLNLLSLPLFHVSGASVGLFTLYAGAGNYILPEVSVPRMLKAFKESPITKVGLVPAVMAMLLDDPECSSADFTHLNTVVYGAAPISPDLLQRCMQTMRCGFVQLFGMTETCTLGTVLKVEDHDPAHPERLLSCGRPCSGVELKVVSGDGQPLGPEESGEVILRTLGTMRGYFGRAEETARAVRDGWYFTGDGGYIDKDGYLFLRDRIKDMIVSGGENVYPAEVEKILAAHPGVADVGVIGVPDAKWGEAVKAIVVLRKGHSLSASELIDFARRHIAGYKCPKTIDFVESLPRNPSGKILKRVLRAPYWSDGRQVN